MGSVVACVRARFHRLEVALGDLLIPDWCLGGLGDRERPRQVKAAPYPIRPSGSLGVRRGR